MFGGTSGRPAHDLFDFFGKFRRIRRLDNDGRRVAERFHGRPILKALPRDRAVRFEQQLIFIPELANARDGARVGNRSGKNIAAHRGEVGQLVDFAGLVHLPAINRHQPREVARMPDVHRVGKRVARRRKFFGSRRSPEISETRRCR